VESGDLQQRVPLEGRYANFFKVGHNAYEFILEFGQLYEPEGRPGIHTRIITSPAYVQELLRTLQEALAEHERQSAGEIEPGEGQK
jgi:hypothetical protein